MTSAAVPELFKKLTGHKVKRKAGVALVRELERRYHDDSEAVDKFRALCERLGVKHNWKNLDLTRTTGVGVLLRGMLRLRH